MFTLSLNPVTYTLDYGKGYAGTGEHAQSNCSYTFGREF